MNKNTRSVAGVSQELAKAWVPDLRVRFGNNVNADANLTLLVEVHTINRENGASDCGLFKSALLAAPPIGDNFSRDHVRALSYQGFGA